jgi:hypothetical protein
MGIEEGRGEETGFLAVILNNDEFRVKKPGFSQSSSITTSFG